jgi:hypothetical protein
MRHVKQLGSLELESLWACQLVSLSAYEGRPEGVAAQPRLTS